MANQQIILPPASGEKQTARYLRSRNLVIVGANGSGKSRFAARMASDLGNRAFTLSALNAIYYRSPSESAKSNSAIDRLYFRSAESDGIPPAGNSTQLERVMWLLMRDEMLNLLDYKLRHVRDSDTALAPTKLDSVIEQWQEIFPDNRILIESGRLLFTSRGTVADKDPYGATRLSAGEKSVMYYLGAISYAPQQSVVFVDSPEMFLHPTIMQSVWNRIEMLRPDCTFVYTTHDLDFAASRTDKSVLWVRSYDARNLTWDYTILPDGTTISDEIYSAILGARKPVLFIEGDSRHSIDMKLYSLIFKDFTVKPLGSCNKVIEATRTFNELNAFHKMDSYGIVDRDRRDEKEVDYLRSKRIMVPEVAEVENILMLEDVVRAVAHHCGKDENRVFTRVKRSVMNQFAADLRQQALLHTRHRVKRTVECRIDGRFTDINMLERHITGLMREINPRGLYNRFVEKFNDYKTESDYRSVLKVYNQKSMLPGSNVAGLCGLSGKEDYIAVILEILRRNTADAPRITKAIRACFNLDNQADQNEKK